ncbi:MAG TPA: hypothetical protein VFN23_16460 [Ktedonobacteraceae bacterium]|nr:hypothetical protein [Ktedonobacteraceae bacterium]
MSFQICIKTEKSLETLALEIGHIFSLPPFKLDMSSEEPYCQFEMLGMLALIQHLDVEERDPEVSTYNYCFDLQLAFSEHELDTDDLEYRLQPYYAQLLSFRLGLDTAYQEKQPGRQGWQIRYRFCHKNQNWNAQILYGEKGWQPAITESPPSPWRSMHPVF